MDTICINENYTQEWLDYFKENRISYPKQDKLYTIRKIVQNTKGEKGLLLNEIINPEVNKKSPLTGFTGKTEQNFAISRFANLDGTPVLYEQIKETITI
jgi:3,4-dihydroxy-2-butanone 4-phosphate synthase